MEPTTHIQYIMVFAKDAMILTAVPLGAATAIGLVISIIQAVTQIQDQTLSQTVKLAVIGTSLILLGSTLTAPLVSSTRDLFDNFASVGR